MTGPQLSIRGLCKSFGGIAATDNVDLDIDAGEIHAIIGPNGAGKTTLINLLSGLLSPDGGTIQFDGANITRASAPKRCRRGLARSFQITSIFREATALDNVALAVQAATGHSFRFWRAAGGDPALCDPAYTLLERVGLADRASVQAGNLAHGEQRQLEIAMVLATKPKMLLLDEPMAGMGSAESERLIALLAELKGHYTMLLIEHDMDAVFALADRITVLVYGRTIATGTPTQIRANTDVRRAYLGDDEEGA
ncbi:MAG: ABC transporter ATP-binding protein [Alphaproteobacteria bacterium]